MSVCAPIGYVRDLHEDLEYSQDMLRRGLIWRNYYRDLARYQSQQITCRPMTPTCDARLIDAFGTVFTANDEHALLASIIFWRTRIAVLRRVLCALVSENVEINTPIENNDNDII